MLSDSDHTFVLIEMYRYLLKKQDGQFYVSHRMEDKTGYDFDVNLTFPPDYFFSHTVDEFYEDVARYQPLRAYWVNRKTEVTALESQLKVFGWIPLDSGETKPASVIVNIGEKNHTISREPDGCYLVVHEPEPGDKTDIPVRLRLPEDYMSTHTHLMLYDTIAECQKSRAEYCPISNEMIVLYYACFHMGWPITWGYTR